MGSPKNINLPYLSSVARRAKPESVGGSAVSRVKKCKAFLS